MTSIEERLAAHYVDDGHGPQLVERLLDALRAAGHDTRRLHADALAGADEFHLGGRAATDAFVSALGLGEATRVLDVGCGIGGPARRMARISGCHVTGVDLCAAWVAAARDLSERVGLAPRVAFRVGSGTDLPFEAETFDVVTLIHVGMNIADKPRLLGELARVTREGGTVGIYDVMRVAEGPLEYPMPWAADTRSSFVGTPSQYAAAMRAAGLTVVDQTDRTDAVLEVVATLGASPPAIHLGHLMGRRWPELFGRLRAALERRTLAPIQMIGRQSRA